MSWTSRQVADTVAHAVALQRDEFARRLVALRENHDPPLTQEQAAELIGVHPRHYVRWEHGQADPYLSTRNKIAKAYGVDPSYLIAEPGAPLGLGLDGTNTQLADLERKLDLILEHLGLAHAPADPAPAATPLPEPPAVLRPRRTSQRPTEATPAPARSKPATSRQRRAR